MTPDQLAGMPASELIAVVTGANDESHRPLLLKKVRYYGDVRYQGLFDSAAPAKLAE